MSQYSTVSRAKIKTIADLQQMKQAGQKITSLTAYDASFTALLDQAGVDILLVGDSLGMVVQGHASTLPVNMQDMLYHTQIVSRGRQQAFIIADLPFMSSATPLQAAENAALLIQQGGAQMVKLEGAKIEAIEFMVQQGIPVCAHLGLLPQSIYQLGKYTVQGKLEKDAAKILADAVKVEQAGAQMLIVECIPASLAEQISEQLLIPVIGIGAGVHCDGQVLVLYDMLDISLGRKPRFSKNYMQQSGSILEAIQSYVAEVREQKFPAQEHSF
ncbi:3-methyl-2-oxobutanoate hydroxymethyltransferase [Methyloprofundus sedimenti]|uniref:3-methyl-2-oxobutanoate hydroxymethyltransferase n=1 Tax=Methyloprofundus sedimenti TaxID=1420851 RepID=A0A1V8M303_9GAMM|nr:3-methyl-2-oxobutanoate hydroxymethyltransferase [Methyloprofundus sedimenti]OQK15912.1 3-methyl-2-oxobutanoate hydroxymethyltransferase [Methyloprofundus sedimenti]